MGDSRGRHSVLTIAERSTGYLQIGKLERHTAAETSECCIGLIRQYLPKGKSMAHVTQADCDEIAARINSRPRKRLGYKTPEECYVQTR